MRSLRFLTGRRWIILALVVVFLTYAAWWLGEWQFGRLTERKASNAIIRANEQRLPTPAASVLSPGGDVPEGAEWRVVEATGEYAPDDTVIVRYRTRDGAPGVDVVVPLVTADGTALLVDRGWVASEANGQVAPEVPPPPPGEVTVTGYVRADGTGDSTIVSDQQTRAVSSAEIGEALDRPLYGGFVELRTESPEPATALVPVELPELDNGPHFFYGLQWWFFGLLAVVGFCYLTFDEWRGRSRVDRPRRRSSLQESLARRGDRSEDAPEPTRLR